MIEIEKSKTEKSTEKLKNKANSLEVKLKNQIKHLEEENLSMKTIYSANQVKGILMPKKIIKLCVRYTTTVYTVYI